MTQYLDIPFQQAPDTQPVRTTSWADLNLELVEEHIAQASRRGRYAGEQDPIQYLLDHRGAVDVDDQDMPVPTIAGILLFGHAPQRLLPHATVDIGHFYGTHSISTEVVHMEKSVSGHITTQIEKIERYLWSNIHHGFRLGDGAQRIEEHEYPPSVLRELTVNALAHRDYTSGQVTRVSLFRDRIEWDNPGRLPAGVTIATIRQSQMPRNPAILNFLYQAGFVEGFGMGWDTVFQALQDEELPPPVLQETPASFLVTVYGRPRLGFVEPILLSTEVTGIQAEIYHMVVEQGSVSRSEVEQLLPDRSARSIQRDLQALVDLGLIVISGAGRALRYRIAKR